MGAFGEKLRKQRELRGIELDAISNTTKISTRMLRALEDERFDQLPGGVFNKGFVRAYARQVGLDEQETVADYLAAARERQIEQRSHSDVADFSPPAEKPAPVAAPEPRDNVVPSASLPPGKPASQNDGDSNPNHDLQTKDIQTNDIQTKDLQTKELQTNDVRTQDRRHLGIRGDRRNEDRRNEDRRVEVRRNPNHRDQNPLSENPRSEAPRSEARAPQTQNQDFPALPDAPPRAPAADPRGERFRQKYPAGDPAPADESSLPIPWGKLALALLLVTLFLAFWNFGRNAQPPAASQNTSSSHLSPAPASSPVAAPTQPSSSAPTLTGSPASQAGTTSAKTAPTPTITAATPPNTNPAPATPPAPAAAAPATNSVSPATSAAASAAKPAANVPQPDAKPPAPNSAARTAAAKPPTSFTLQIRADETTWITLTADGKPVVANETLIAPAHTSVRASREIVVKTGNAAGISFLLNGKAIPPQGNEGEIRTYVFDATGLQPSPN